MKVEFDRSKRLHVYVDSTSLGSAFYVGKGVATRIRSTVRNKKHHDVATTYGLRRVVVFSSDNEQDVFSKEIELIATHKTYVYENREVNPLACNFTRGGDGSSGFKHTLHTRELLRERARQRQPISEETRQRLVNSHIGIKRTPESIEKSRQAQLGDRNSSKRPEVKAKISASNTGKRHTELTRHKMSQSHAGQTPGNAKSLESIDESGNTCVFASVRRAAKILGFHHAYIYASLADPDKFYRGYKWRYRQET